MSTAVTHDTRVPGRAHDLAAAPPSSRCFDWAATVLSALFTGGVFLDGWAHTHGRVDETFFTPWHAALYSGFFATAALLVWRATWGLGRGHGWRAAMPEGYGWALVGVGCWLVGGPFDVAWHSVFGFEAGVEALLSPAHAMLAVGLGLMASGPLRAGLRRAPGRWRDELPVVLSLTFVVSNLTFFTQIAHPVSNLWATRGRYGSHDAMELGITGLLLTTAIVMGPLLLLLRYGRLPAGAVAILITLNSVAMGFVYDQGPYPLAAVAALSAAAVAGDMLQVALRPSAARPAALRLFAVALPVLLHAAYFAAVHFTSGIGWTPHLWLGVVVFSGAIGWLLSYLVLPPRGL